jgi:integrase
MAQRITFTQLAVDRLKPPAEGRETHWDRHLPGFGLRVSAPRPGSREGRKTWVAMGRVDGKPVMATLGTLAQIPKVEKARDAARAALLKMKSGTNPLNERRAEAARRRAEAEEAAARAEEAQEGRFAAVAERFVAAPKKRGGARSPGYADELRRMLKHDVLPKWGDRSVRSITRSDVNDLIDAKARSRNRPRKGAGPGASIQANRLLAALRALFRWAAAQALVDADPTSGVLARGAEEDRDRVLDRREFFFMWHGSDRIGRPFGPIFKLLALTGARKNEVAAMRWAEVDLEQRIWTIPSARTKGDRTHIVHLSDAAIEILETLPRTGELVFSTTGETPVSGFSAAKRRLDAEMAKEAGAPIPDWRIHDIRRSSATMLAEDLKVAPQVVDKILNHSNGVVRGVAAIYNRALHLDERRAALEALGRYIESLVRPGGDINVVLMRA